MSSREKLDNLLQRGLVKDIFQMERAYFLIKETSARGSDIDRKSDFTELFQVNQNAYLIDAIMAVARIYDKRSKKNPTLCIKSILYFIENNTNDLIPIIERPNLKRHLGTIKAPEYLIYYLDINDDVLYTKMLVEYFKILCFSGDNQDRILKLKNIRDKRLAHNENTFVIDSPTLTDLKELILNAQKIVATIGWSYLSPAQVYMYEGKYFLSDDAARTSLSLKKLLNIVLS